MTRPHRNPADVDMPDGSAEGSGSLAAARANGRSPAATAAGGGSGAGGALDWSLVCRAEELADGGDGVRFSFRRGGEDVPAFVVRSEGVARAYVNRCRHVAVELDWQPGRFFDETGLYLICATHGATYRASDGACAGGPCRGRALESLEVREHDGAVSVLLPAAANREFA
jgi:nitrite reductase/ring-hydroxylating ferredoxin subunit